MEKEKRKGICTNFGQCDKADKHEVQEVNPGESFVCSNPSCGKELTEIKSKSSKNPYRVLGLVALCVVVLLFLLFRNCKGNHNEVIVDTTIVDTIVDDTPIVKDTTKVDTTVKNGTTIRDNGRDDERRRTVITHEPVRAVRWGDYVGHKDADGIAHGTGTVTRVTNEYSLGGGRILRIGDRIENANFVHGDLVSGKIYTRDGTSYDYAR